MKNFILLIAVLFYIPFSMAQWSKSPVFADGVVPGSPDDSFILIPDTVKFLSGNDFIEGKEFSIVNPHNYPVDVQHIDNFGIPCPECIAWHITPYVSNYPVTIPANSSITYLVQFYVVDAASTIFVNDTLNVNTAGNSRQVIITADSNMILIGMAEPGGGRMVAYPNPFSDRLNITICTTDETKAEVLIYNALGQPVKELFTGNISPSGRSFYWDGSDRSGTDMIRGIYFIRIKTPSGQKMLKVVKV